MSDKEMIKLKVDNIEVEIEKGSTVLDAARKAGIDVPTLCFLKDINEVGACRMCLVEVEGMRNLATSCMLPANDGMIIKTNTPEVLKTRKMTLELLLSNHNRKCLTCVRSENCELQAMAKKFGIEDLRFTGEKTKAILDKSSPCIVRDNSKCILCGRCVNVCKNVQSVSALTKVNRGFETYIGIAEDMPIVKSTCVGCGQCIVNCPVGALRERDYIEEVIQALNNPEMHVVIQTAPAVRATIGEEFGMEIGTLATEKLVGALKAAGFDKVFDTDLAADITIMEEGTEFIGRLKNGGKLPMITSCSSGWITFAEKFYPELLDNLSTAKSPMEIMGVLIKRYYSEKMGIPSDKIFSVALMPCSAKKGEMIRENLELDGERMIDAVLTTREAARMLKAMNIDLKEVEEKEYDNPLGIATGAGHIFGVTGGVMEAALRTVSEILENKELEKIEYKEIRGIEGIKEAVIEIAGIKVNIAVAQGLANCRKVMEEIKAGTCKYHFVEVMTCPGGCIMGGGQPLTTSYQKAKYNIPKLRAKALYLADEKATYRKSHNNPDVKKIYDEYLEKPNSKKAHELLHTKYTKQDVYVRD